jgi:hypothetical protein
MTDQSPFPDNAVIHQASMCDNCGTVLWLKEGEREPPHLCEECRDGQSAAWSTIERHSFRPGLRGVLGE